MPTYDVTFKVSYEQTLRLEAEDDDHACEDAADAARAAIPAGARWVDVGFYCSDEVKS